MNYKIETTPDFDKDFKKLFKKYHSLKSDLTAFISSLRENPTQGIPLGKNCYKIRLSISSKNKGKSGGSRVITNIVIDQHTIYLLTIYDKSNKENLTDTELNQLLENVPE